MSLVSISEASRWATDYLGKDVSPTNISYLVQYGKVRKHGENGSKLGGHLKLWSRGDFAAHYIFLKTAK